MKQSIWRMKTISWVAAGVAAGALGTIGVQAVARNAFMPLPVDEYQQFAAVFELIKQRYVEPADDKKMMRDAIAGMVSGLDAHSAFLDKKAFKEFQESFKGKFGGVGMEVGMEEGLVRVVAPIEGSPAFKAGVQTGDLITKIDDTFVKGLTQDQAIKRLRGDPGTKVSIVVFRKSESRSFTLNLVRDEIKVQAVKAKLIEPGFAWVRITSFQEEVLEDFAKKVSDIYKQSPNLKGMVLDLRTDPGGSLDGAIGVSAAFLPANSVIVSTKGQVQNANAVYRGRKEDYARRTGEDPLKNLPAALKSVPLVVLIDGGSASASEIVAGALQDHKRATLMGTQSFGKGSVQTLQPLGPEMAVKLTTQRYYTPSGRSIQAKGIVPDVWLDETAEGNVTTALRMREADLDKHLNADQGTADGAKDAAREKAAEEARKKLEAELAKKPEERKRLPEYGSKDDFQLAQALHKLKGEPVKMSTELAERKPDSETQN